MSLPDRPRMAVIAHRIAICQHPNGEGVWWDTDAHPHPGCIQDCDCTPVEYVRADLHAGVVEAARKLGSAYRANEPIAFALVELEDALGLTEQGGQSA